MELFPLQERNQHFYFYINASACETSYYSSTYTILKTLTLEYAKEYQFAFILIRIENDYAPIKMVRSSSFQLASTFIPVVVGDKAKLLFVCLQLYRMCTMRG